MEAISRTHTRRTLCIVALSMLVLGGCVRGAAANPFSQRELQPLGPGTQKLSAGLHVLDLVALDAAGTGPAHLPKIEVTVPGGWRNNDGFALLRFHGTTYVMALSFWDV